MPLSPCHNTTIAVSGNGKIPIDFSIAGSQVTAPSIYNGIITGRNFSPRDLQLGNFGLKQPQSVDFSGMLQSQSAFLQKPGAQQRLVLMSRVQYSSVNCAGGKALVWVASHTACMAAVPRCHMFRTGASLLDVQLDRKIHQMPGSYKGLGLQITEHPSLPLSMGGVESIL